MKKSSTLFYNQITQIVKRSLIFFCLLLLNISNLSGQWTQLGQDLLGEGDYDQHGTGLSISGDGNTIAAGSHQNSEHGINRGHVRVYRNIGGTWIQLGSDIEGEMNGERMGFAVSLSFDGSIIAISGIGNTLNGTDSGLCRIYQYQGGLWIQIGSTILGEGPVTYFGRSISLSNDGNIFAVSATSASAGGIYRGLVRVYENMNNSWIQVGSDINGEADNDHSGIAIEISDDGSSVIIGAEKNDGGGIDRGHARVYKNIGGTWIQQGSDIDGEFDNDQSGFGVSISSNGSIVAVGEYLNSSGGFYRGRVRVYKIISGNWVQQGSAINGEADEDYFGESVSLSADGTTIVAGAGGNSGGGMYRGQTRVYQFISNNWIQTGSGINGEEDFEISGTKVSISNDGSIVASAAPFNAAGGEYRGIVRAYNFIEIEDEDCDGVVDAEDLCPGGDDSIDNNNDGLPDCHHLPLYDDIIPEWKCGNNKVWISHFSNDGTCHSLCISYGAAQEHLNHGDYLGTCDNSICNRNLFLQGPPEQEDALIQALIISAWPNPTDHEFTLGIDSESDDLNVITVFDILGSIILQMEKSETQFIRFGEELSDGVYFINVRQGQNSNTIKMIKHGGIK